MVSLETLDPENLSTECSWSLDLLNSLHHGAMYVELVLNPNISTTLPWENIGGTSLAQYCELAAIQTGGDITTDLNGDAGYLWILWTMASPSMI